MSNRGIRQLDLAEVNEAIRDLDDEIRRVEEALDQVRAGTRAFTGTVDFGGQRASNAATSQSDTDLVTRGEFADLLDEIDEQDDSLGTSETEGRGGQRGRRRRTSRRRRDMDAVIQELLDNVLEGGVVFGGIGDNAIMDDSTNLFWDRNAHNLGIRTGSSIVAELDVRNNDAGGNGIVVRDAAGRKLSIWSNEGGASLDLTKPWIGYGASDGLTLATGSASGAFIFRAAGNFSFFDAAGATARLTVTSTATSIFPTGSAATPSLNWIGDSNSGIYRPAEDEIAISTGGVERLRITSTETVVNDTGTATDFRVESDTITHLLFIDASTNRVGIGTDTPGTMFDMLLTGTTSADVFRIRDTATRTFQLAASSLAVDTTKPYITGESAESITVASGSTAGASIGLRAPKEIQFLTSPGTVKALIRTLTAGATDFNSQSENIDFRVRSQTKSMLFVDASADRLGVGVETPGSFVDVLFPGTTSTDIVKLRDSSGRTLQLGAISSSATLSLPHLSAESSNNCTLAAGNGAGTQLFLKASDYVAFQDATAGSNKVRISVKALNNTNFNFASDDIDFIISGTSVFDLFHLDAGVNRILLGGETAIAPTARVHIVQDSLTGAIPCLTLDQDDIDKPVVSVLGQESANATDTISTLGTAGTIDKWLQIDVNGVKRWIALYQDPS